MDTKTGIIKRIIEARAAFIKGGSTPTRLTLGTKELSELTDVVKAKFGTESFSQCFGMTVTASLDENKLEVS